MTFHDDPDIIQSIPKPGPELEKNLNVGPTLRIGKRYEDIPMSKGSQNTRAEDPDIHSKNKRLSPPLNGENIGGGRNLDHLDLSHNNGPEIAIQTTLLAHNWFPRPH